MHLSDRVYAASPTALPASLDGLPLGSYVVGDAAYTLSDKCITPFTGSQRLNPTKDAYNYFLSQVWIRIEMAFGLLTTKWQILKRPLGSERRRKEVEPVVRELKHLADFEANSYEEKNFKKLLSDTIDLSEKLTSVGRMVEKADKFSFFKWIIKGF